MMIKKFFGMIFGGPAATPATAIADPSPLARPFIRLCPQEEEAPEFKTPAFCRRYAEERAGLEGRLRDLEDEIVLLERQKPAAATQSAEQVLARRREVDGLEKAKWERSNWEFKLRRLGGALMEEERRQQLNQYLSVPVILPGNWGNAADWGHYNPVASNCRQSQRRLIRWKGEYIIMVVCRDSAKSNDWFEPYGPEYVVWATTSFDQMTNEELAAIVADQQARVDG